MQTGGVGRKDTITPLIESRVLGQSVGVVVQPDGLVYEAGPSTRVEDWSVGDSTDRALRMVPRKARVSDQSIDVENPRDSMPAVRVVGTDCRSLYRSVQQLCTAVFQRRQ